MADFIAMFRGINVGRAKRIAMVDLRQVFVDLEFSNVRSVLNSGNVLFSSPRAVENSLARTISESVERSFGVSAAVIVISGAHLRRVVENNPLLSLIADPSRHLVAFSTSPTGIESARPLMSQQWQPDALAVTADAAYLWCAEGVLDSPLSKAFARVTRDGVTARNWTTILKLLAAVGPA